MLGTVTKLENIDISRIAICKNKDLDPETQVACIKEDIAQDKCGDFAVQMEVIKAIPMRRFDRRKKEYRFIKSIVMTPRKLDKQDDWVPEDEIEDGVHEFMINLQSNKSSDPDESGISYRHQRLVKNSDARIVECCTTDFPETWNGKTFPAGSWKVGIRVYDESMFPEIDRGELRGCSIEGTATHTKEPLS